MNIKIKTVFMTLMLFMGVFFTPKLTYAQSDADTEPPMIHAEINEGMLHIEASDENAGVDAVWLNGGRIDYPENSPLDLSLEDYAQNIGQMISIYATDSAGNRSNVVELENPLYPGSASASASADPAEQPKNPLTPNGQATVLDHADDGDGKEFFTFTTPDEHIFYLVIDRQRDQDNVYFLNTVTESDLMALAEKSEGTISEPESTKQEISVCTCKEKCISGEVDIDCVVCRNDLKSCLGKEREEPLAEEKTATGTGISMGTWLLILFAALASGGCGYYLKVYKPKHDLDDAEDLDDLLGDAETEVNEDEEEINEDADGNESEKSFSSSPENPSQQDRESNGEILPQSKQKTLPQPEQETGNEKPEEELEPETETRSNDTTAYDDYPDEKSEEVQEEDKETAEYWMDEPKEE